MDLYKDEDLGLEDMEYFKEFLKFKKNRALQKAREAEDAQKVVAGTIEAGTNPPPPGTSPELQINPSPPSYVPLPVSTQTDRENGIKNCVKALSAQPSPEYEPVSIPSIEKKVEEVLLPTKDAGRSNEKQRTREGDRRDRDRPDQSRSRDMESRSRHRSRSRERESWRQRRSRTRSRSPRDRRESREHRYDSRARYDARFQPRRRSREMSPRRTNNYSPHNAAPHHNDRNVNANFTYPVTHTLVEQLPPPMSAPVITTEWNPMQATQQWEPQAFVDVPYQASAEEQARKLAVEKEAQQQKETFIAQRKEYLLKRENLIVEMGLLKAQRRELAANGDMPQIQKIISGNIKLQEEISTKIKSVDNVLDMLKRLSGDQDNDVEQPTPPPSPDRESDKDKKKQKKRKRSRSGSASSAAKDGSRRSRSRKREQPRDRDDEKSSCKIKEKELSRRGREHENQRQDANLVFYDPEVHWCRACKAFPSTAKEYLLHLHSSEHKQTTQERKLNDLPWHELAEHKEPVVVKGLETKRCPIKGLQFFEASTAWFCKLCQSWMGDLHCASLHLKSELHNKNYDDFSMNNPKWEASWLSDRGKAVISSGKNEDILKRQLAEQLLLQKKHEQELKVSTEPATGLVMPLNLLTKPAPKIKGKTKKKGKDKKKSKKKKRSQSSTSSGTSSSSSASSSSSDDEKTDKKKKTKKKKNLKVVVPEKSKWEKNDSEEEKNDDLGGSGSGPRSTMDARRARNYRWAENLSRPPRPASPPHVPEKHSILIPESTKVHETSRQLPSPSLPNPHVPSMRVRTRDRDGPGDDGEARFDKQAQAAAKKKKEQAALPKAKFAFIGRMPFAKRRYDPEDKPRKEQDVATPDPTPPPPPVISKKVVPVETPPPVLTNKTKVFVAKEILTKNIYNRQAADEFRPVDPVLMEVDMDIDKAEPSPPRIELPPSPPTIRPVLPPEVTTNYGKKMMAVPLPKDFQEALSIIYPEQPPKMATPPLPPSPPAGRVPSPPPQVETPPPPLPPDFDFMPQAPTPPHTFELPTERACAISNMADYDDFDEMALLGIDKEDMAAQRF